MSNERYSRQVELLLQVLPLPAEQKVFALKDGTAINLFMRDMPRLSVDIDVTYLPLGSEAKPLPATKADLGLLFNFHDGEKSSMYRSGYICGFSPSRKSNINPTSPFLLRVGFASLPLESRERTIAGISRALSSLADRICAAVPYSEVQKALGHSIKR